MTHQSSRAGAVAVRVFCDACTRAQPEAGFQQLGRYQLCRTCAAEFAAAGERDRQLSIGRYTRDKRFGEAARYALDAE